ncbi:hypothetical protein H072_573 [Dactylellina haptotyla CBS 200.50]|uniref:Uncharacterized protein n=1 Tax=Dactylellina haptotyla (strain CBS 200.50) TaxID=1284197 RepID=S8CCL8_DACHA|nr:hypothetical protein H072_573 [Dactylellina haptotyla CBS 200.50]
MSDPANYTVGWVCAKTCEFVAAINFLVEPHEDPEFLPAGDYNGYKLGRIGQHNVVITLFPDGDMGKAVAASVLANMLRSFPNIKICLMVGIGGGVPTNTDIRLGDVIVGVPRNGHGGVFQYDFGQALQNQDKTYTFRCDGFLNQPPDILRSAVGILRVRYENSGHNLEEDIQRVIEKNPRLVEKYARPNSDSDRLFASEYVHGSDPQLGVLESASEQCTARCNRLRLINRPRRSEGDNIIVHYGLIASADQRMKDAILRDKYANDMKVLCFEMEAAGLMNRFPCLAIRGISDYSDSHKNDSWQGYASMTAASYAKDLLLQIRPTNVEAQTNIAGIKEILSTLTEDVKAFHADTRDTHKSVKNIEFEREQEKIINWLSPPDPSINYNTALEKHHPGSGSWFLEGKTYFTWKTQPGSNSTLWISGGTGSGKTVLSSAIIRDLQHDPSYQPVLYFYFSFQEADKQAAHNMIRSLITQLSCRQPETLSSLINLYSSCESGCHQPTYKQLCDTFFQMTEQVKEIWLVLDAINECTKGKRELLLWIKKLLSIQRHIRLILTGQPGTDIMLELTEFIPENNVVSLHNSFVIGDISNFIEASIQTDEGFRRWRGNRKVQKEISDALSKKADVMFQWAALQLQSLQGCIDLHSLRYTLKSLPNDLNGTYERIMNNIPMEKRPNAIRILQFLAYSERPLSVKEAVDALAVQIDENDHFEFNPEFRMPDYHDILSLCPGLLVYVFPRAQSRRPLEVDLIVEMNEETQIQLLHFSVREYILSTNLSGIKLEKDFKESFQEINAKTAIAKVCLVYLLELNKKLSMEALAEEFPFVRYCSSYWASFAASVAGRGGSGSLQNLINQLFIENEESYRNCCSFFLPDRPWATSLEIQESEQPPALYYASFCGFINTVEILINVNEGAGINAYGGYYGTALCAALENNQDEIFEFLLSKGADVNAQYGDRETALCIASRNGQARVVELLLGKGAKVNARNGHYGSALCAAAIHGHSEIVKTLLTQGANVNEPLEHYGSALCAASCNGYYEVVELLLPHIADVNFQGGDYGSALCAASCNGYTRIVTLLLKHGAKVNLQGGDYGSALYAASYNGHHEVAKLLRNNYSSDEDSTSGSWEDGDFEFADPDPFDDAAATTDKSTRPAFLTIDSDQALKSDNEFEFYSSMLFTALRNGDDIGIEIILSKFKELNLSLESKRDFLMAALAMTMENGCHKVAIFLLEAGAKTKIHDQEYYRLLSKALEKDQVAMVNLLLDSAADFHISSELSLTIQESQHDLTVLLLNVDERPDLDSKEKLNFHKLISIFLKAGQADLAEILLRKILGKIPRVKCQIPGDVLVAAMLGNHDRVAVSLLELGVGADLISNRFNLLLDRNCTIANSQTARVLANWMTDSIHLLDSSF